MHEVTGGYCFTKRIWRRVPASTAMAPDGHCHHRERSWYHFAVQWPQRSCDHRGRWMQEPGENRALARPGRSAENYLSCSRISLI